MKHLHLSLALGLVSAATALPALAVDPSQVIVDNRLYVGGATATNRLLGRFAINSVAGQQLCDNTSQIDVYSSVAAGDTDPNNIFNANQWAVLCKANATNTGLEAGTNIAIYKEGVGGSGNGVTALSLHTPIGFLNLGAEGTPTAAGTGCSATSFDSTIPAATGYYAFQAHTGCGLSTANIAPNVGMSDVNPELLSTNQTVLDNLTALGTVGNVFAPIVTLKLYRKLQAAQGLVSTCGTDSNGFEDTAATDDADDCDEAAEMPTLTMSQLGSLLTGNTTNWNQLTSDAGAAMASSSVWLCRRGPVSGTQATFETVVLNQRCVKDDTTIPNFRSASQTSCSAPGSVGCTWNATLGTGTNTFGDDVVFAGNSSGQVTSCINFRDTQSQDAIGILSVESKPALMNTTTSGATGTFRYIGVNRAVPDLLSTASGNYPIWSENTWNTANDVTLSDVQNGTQSFIQARLSNEVVIEQLNKAFSMFWGDGGALGLPTINSTVLAPPFTKASVAATPVNVLTKSPTGAVQDCGPPIVHSGKKVEAGGENQVQNTSKGP